MINWTLPFLFTNDDFAISIYDDFKAKFNKPLFNNVYGGFIHSWYGGILRLTNEFDIDMVNVIREYNKRDIIPYINFNKANLSNEEIDNNWEHLQILRYNNLKYGLIVSNIRLLKKIKEFDSSIPIMCSPIHFYAKDMFCYREPRKFTDTLKDEKAEQNYIKRLFHKGFDYVIPRSEIMYDIWQLPLRYCKKLQILINSHCTPNCPFKVAHLNNTDKYFKCARTYDSYEVSPFSWEDWCCYTDNSLEYIPEWSSNDNLTQFTNIGISNFILDDNLNFNDKLLEMEKYMFPKNTKEREFISSYIRSRYYL